MNSLCPLSSLVEKQREKDDQDPNLKLYIFSSTSNQILASSSSSQSSQLAFATTQHDHQTLNLHHHHLQQSHHQLHQLDHHHQIEKSIGGSREDISSGSCNLVKEKGFDEVEDKMKKKKQDNNNAKNWMSSKMRLMQKMMTNTSRSAAEKIDSNSNSNSDSDHAKATQNNFGKWEISSAGGRSSWTSNNNNGVGVGVRVCSDCNTTTTPLWRSGPQGPKSLCNACGIRQRKARRAMAEAANGGGGGGGSVVVASEVHKEKKSRLSWHGDDGGVSVGDDHVMKKKCSKMSRDEREEGGMNEVSFDHRHNFTLRLSKSGSAFGRVFPRDEEEAAILLMELSCGLLRTC